ncbi:large ribosomal subunit protein uL3m [Phlebotomus argentipes]|uniref:large ribosomal subunit protein uL3m n=1 Tax=Phlebotomus argentipes TaxID=94469 RepID=UPI002892CD08|nr:large ribosomal subunit protein uL3m [Phlebotomus argentipes]
MLGIRTVKCLSSLGDQFARISLKIPNLTRGKNFRNYPKLRLPYWFVRQETVKHDDLISRDNKQFVQEVLHDQFGVPSLIKGVMTYPNASSGLHTGEAPQVEWRPFMRRTGVIAKKIGEYPLWLKNGKKIRTTLLQVIDNHVVKYYPPESFDPKSRSKIRNLNRYGCVLVGAASTDPSVLTKEYCGLFKDSGVMPKARLARFIISPEAQLLPGTPLNVTHFRVGDFVDVRGKTLDRGFQGVMKRWGFHGMPASHGQTKTHRRPGNIGGGGEKGRVWPGKKMPGHMGNRYRVMRGLRIWRINTKYNVMWVQGNAICGEVNNFVTVLDSILPLRRCTTAPAFPTHFESTEELPENIWHEDVHNFDDPTILYEPE